ncbi:hypothetical protein SAMN05428969_2026 [Devosia sp. YR412]|uniref:hypothetical protein n=1 Tax=Devosia sp. YR412 TaxID=1881030 RepID=UPI0008CBD42C|nr:hypothetical protein [Devosia sp. YR412]SEQ11227.1 hypothetical protein SAMN05428969_2026 [Devosia sp. YR412]
MAPTSHCIDQVTAVQLQVVYDKARSEGLDPDRAMETERRVFRHTCECDPSAEGIYLDWLSTWRQRWWQDRTGFHTAMTTSDVSRLLMGLHAYHAARATLPADQQDIDPQTG